MRKRVRNPFSDEDIAFAKECIARRKKQIGVTCEWSTDKPRMCMVLDIERMNKKRIMTSNPPMTPSESNIAKQNETVEKWAFDYLTEQQPSLWRPLLKTVTESNENFSIGKESLTIKISIGPYCEITLYFLANIANYSDDDLHKLGKTIDCDNSTFKHDYVQRLVIAQVGSMLSDDEDSDDDIPKKYETIFEPNFTTFDVVKDQSHVSIFINKISKNVSWRDCWVKDDKHKFYHKIIFFPMNNQVVQKPYASRQSNPYSDMPRAK